MDPKLKLRPLTKDTKLLSFDAETNGLHGSAFAIGAVLVRADGQVVEEFEGRAPIRGKTDTWVKENVLPSLKDVPIDQKSQKDLRQSFWQWYVKAKEKADYVLVANGYPVEARLLIACQEENLKERYWSHPFPLLELNSLLMQVGVNPLGHKIKFVADEIKGQAELQHHPRFDAWVAALAGFKALRMSGQLPGKIEK